MDLCPRCHRRYESCTCAADPATKGAGGSVNARTIARAHFRAWRTLRQVSDIDRDIATIPEEHQKGREFSTGKIANGGGQVDGYLKNYTQQERENLKERNARAAKGMTPRVKSPQTPPQTNEDSPGG